MPSASWVSTNARSNSSISTSRWPGSSVYCRSSRTGQQVAGVAMAGAAGADAAGLGAAGLGVAGRGAGSARQAASATHAQVAAIRASARRDRPDASGMVRHD
jgi:hypothetical protein